MKIKYLRTLVIASGILATFSVHSIDKKNNYPDVTVKKGTIGYTEHVLVENFPEGLSILRSWGLYYQGKKITPPTDLRSFLELLVHKSKLNITFKDSDKYYDFPSKVFELNKVGITTRGADQSVWESEPIFYEGEQLKKIQKELIGIFFLDKAFDSSDFYKNLVPTHKLLKDSPDYTILNSLEELEELQVTALFIDSPVKFLPPLQPKHLEQLYFVLGLDTLSALPVTVKVDLRFMKQKPQK